LRLGGSAVARKRSMRSGCLSLLIAIAIAAIALPAGSTAAASRRDPSNLRSGPSAVVPMSALKHVEPGGRALFKLVFPTRVECTASFAERELPLDTVEFDALELRVSVARRARPGTDTVTIGCAGSDPAHFSVRIRAPRNRPRRYAIPGVSFSTQGRSVRLPSIAEATATAHSRWLSEAAQILGGFRSGQCTDWAAQKRPDVVQRVFESTVVAELLHQPVPPQLGAAQEWTAAAAAAGLTVSDRPRAGALVVWREGVEDANVATGHVGYVESVSADGSTFSTSEMNVGAPYEMGYREASSEPVAGRTFIW
jgi:surface antigen